ncbi:ferritin family protein [Microvirga sp. BT688]|uniref:ferritin-like domain-containing protein n=1 Tax=Microvirga sp. TaxID=1873136 RepID=UPI001685E47D|nr:ferritin family protein [Microvirga sp.]MBD2749667.1 ferritin family protein [Microvirga sp.]
MSLLKSEPAGSVRSLDELFAIAAAMESEAAIRYAEIGERMRREGDPALASVFERLSADEMGHLDRVVHWSTRTQGRNPDPASIRWERSETFDDEGVALAHPRLLTAYRALSMAVRNEERAFAFWSYVAAHAQSTEVRQAAETMAHEELEHVSILRRERRNAFHADRRHHEAHDGQGTTDLAAMEHRLADLLEPLVHKVSLNEAGRLSGFVEEARRNAVELDGVTVPIAVSMLEIPNGPIALAEMLTDRYLEAGDSLKDADALALVQELASRAIVRLAWLRADLPELHDGPAAIPS